MHPLVPRSNFSGTMPGLFIELPRETVRKGFRIAARASILAPHSSEIGLFRPFRGLLRLQFGARGDFSDSLRSGLLGNSIADNKVFPEIQLPVYGVLGNSRLVVPARQCRSNLLQSLLLALAFD